MNTRGLIELIVLNVGLNLGVLSPALQVTAQGPAEAKKHFPTPAELGKLAAVIRPSPEENKWQQIPWITDVNEGLRQAKAEKRPLLLFTIMGEPLDEC
jgi:hypothetical protein